MDFKGINHVAIKARNLDVSDRFYRDFLGMKCVGRRPGMRFYTAGRHHHDLALVEVGAESRSPGPGDRGLAHFCVDVADEMTLYSLYMRFRHAKSPVSVPVDHTVMHSFYALDPDGHLIEFGVDVPRKRWAHLKNPFEEDYLYGSFEN